LLVGQDHVHDLRVVDIAVGQLAVAVEGQGDVRPVVDVMSVDDAPGARSVVVDLVDAEWSLRRRLTTGVSAAEYLERFPDYRDDLLRSRTVSIAPGHRPEGGSTERVPPPERGADGAGDPAADMVTRSHYRALRLHARGGLGEILTARDEELNREVALKRLQRRGSNDPESRERFLREAEITGQLEHPGVVPVYGLGRASDGSPVYAMRLIRGETFQEAIERFHQEAASRQGQGPRSLAFRQLLGRLVSVCNTVAYAHSRGIIHRDLKPSNILLGGFGETLVVDWGLARETRRQGDRETRKEEVGDAAGSGDDSSVSLSPCLLVSLSSSPADLTQDGSVIGTPAYMSPEQAAGRWDLVGPACDVYGLGATLYMLLVGRPAFPEGEVMEVLMKVRQGEFPAPRQVNPRCGPSRCPDAGSCRFAAPRSRSSRFGPSRSPSTRCRQAGRREPS